jgi:hypothetical protein
MCGTDIGGAPTAALPYTLAWCCSITSLLVQRNHWPLTGNPPYPSISGIPDFSNKGSEPPPAPINTKSDVIFLFSSVDRSLTLMIHLPYLFFNFFTS